MGTGARLYRKQTPLMLVVENMVEAGRLRLVVPRVVIEEFRKDRTRVAKASAGSQSLEPLAVQSSIHAGFKSRCVSYFPAREPYKGTMCANNQA